MDLLLQSHTEATDKRMGSATFFSLAKTTHHKIKNEMHCYQIRKAQQVHTMPDGQTVNVD